MNIIKQSGIYKIQNTKNGKCYIGSTGNLMQRKSTHFHNLRSKKHGNPHLQAAFQKYGEAAFIFVPLIICSPDMLSYYEQAIIDGLHPQYNMRPVAKSMLGYKHSDETRMKIRLAGIGRIPTDEIRKRISSGLAGRVLSSESREKISKSLIGTIQSDETRKKKSLARIGKAMPEETKRKISESHMGMSHPQSESTRQKISEGGKKRWERWWEERNKND